MKNLSIPQHTRNFLFGFKTILKSFSVVWVALFFMFSAAYAQAPNISYNSPQVYNPFVALSPLTPTNTGGAIPGPTPVLLGTLAVSIRSVAVDTLGNLYIAGNSSTVITKLSGNTYTSLGSGFLHPAGVAVDAAGNVYVADNGHNAVKEIVAGSSLVLTLASITAPYGIVLDAAGNIYVSAGSVVDRIPAGGGSPVTLASGLKSASGIALDAAGNVYVSDKGNEELKEILASTSGTIILKSGIYSIDGLAVDSTGNIYYTTDNTNITEIPADGSASFSVGNGLTDATSLAVDKLGNIYTESSGSDIDEIQYGVYMMSPALPVGLGFDRKTGIITGTPVVITPAANYTIIGQNSSGSATTTVNIAVSAAAKPNISYNTPQSYNIGTPVLLTPATTGGVVPAPASAHIASGLSVNAIAIDAAGDIYLAVGGATTITEFGPGGVNKTVIGNIHIGNPTGVVTDAAGNVYAVDHNNNNIREIFAGGNSSKTYATGFTYPECMAIDASGNMYVTDRSQNAVLKVPPGGGTATVLVSGLNSPIGVGVDAQGNVYVANNGDNTIREIPAASHSTVTIGTGFNNPHGIAVDPAGNVFVCDKDNNVIKRIPAGGGAPVTLALPIPIDQPSAIALDTNGNIYVSDWVFDTVYEINPGYFINPTLPAGLSISEATGVISGITTAISPKTNYTVSSRNSGGVGVATVEISVNPYQLPSLSYVSPRVYATNVSITPLAPKSTAVFPLNFSSNVTSFASGLTSNEGDAVDAAGNVYVAETSSNQVIKISPDGNTKTTLGSGFSGPAGVAVDAAGNVYVADAGNHAVKEILTGGTILTLGSGFTDPVSVAVDVQGNVYVADLAAGVRKIPAGNGTPVSVGSAALSTSSAVAVDNYGNVFVVDNNVYEILASNGNTIAFTNSSMENPKSVVADGEGNIYYCAHTIGGNQRPVYKIPFGSTTSTAINFGLASSSVDFVYLAVDQAGVLYLSDPTTGTVNKAIPTGGYFINQLPPTGLNFDPNTGIVSGTPTVTSPATNYTVTGYNSGGGGAGTVNISVVGASNTSLSGLTISQGTLRPVFTTATKSYAVTEASTVSSVTLTPTASTTTAAILVNGTPVASGAASAAIPLAVGANTIQVAVTDNGGNSVSNYTLTVTRTGNPNLASLTVSPGMLSPAFNPSTFSYTTTLPAGATSISVTPTLVDSAGTVTINGKQLATGTASPNIQLSLGANTISVVTTSADGSNSKTYTITATRPSANDNLSFLSLSTGSLSPTFNANTLSYTSAVANTVTSTTVKPTTADANATVKVNGTTVTSGTNSSPISLNAGANVITVVVTAQDGSTTKTYSITVTRAASGNASLSAFKISRGTLTPTFASATTSYTASVVNGVTSMTVTPTAAASTATITVNGTAVASGSTSGSIALAVGANTITTLVTAPDHATTETYTLTVTRASGAADSFDPGISVSKPEETPTLADDGIAVHQAVSPNGDGINDFLVIENINQYPDNKLTIMNRSGQLIYEASGYDNASKVFDGHSNKNGQMQLPGTYFYQLDYIVGGIIKHKTGYLVLKY